MKKELEQLKLFDFQYLETLVDNEISYYIYTSKELSDKVLKIKTKKPKFQINIINRYLCIYMKDIKNNKLYQYIFDNPQGEDKKTSVISFVYDLKYGIDGELDFKFITLIREEFDKLTDIELSSINKLALKDDLVSFEKTLTYK